MLALPLFALVFIANAVCPPAVSIPPGEVPSNVSRDPSSPPPTAR